MTTTPVLYEVFVSMIKDRVFRVVMIAALVFLTFQFGLRPIFFRDKNVIKADREYWVQLLPEESSYDYDVIVFGSEPQGIAAAVSSARLGASTLLISQDYDMGGNISRCLIPELEIPLDKDTKMLNGGILEELSTKTGDYFSAEKYISVVNELLQGEKDLNAIAGSSIAGVNMKGKRIDSVKVRTRDGLMDISAGMYIDASDEGILLDYCGIPYFKGSADINMENSYMPVTLNFKMIQAEPLEASDSSMKIGKVEFSNNELMHFKAQNKNVRLDELAVYFLHDNTVVVSGLQVAGVDTLNSTKMKDAYDLAEEEAKSLSRFLVDNFVELKGYEFLETAESLRVHESKHYKGRYMLTVEDILEGGYFEDTAAMGSFPIMISKLAVGGSFIAGKADRYSIPLRCLVPDGGFNLLMAGPRISYSSLASSSAGGVGTCIGIGEAAGAAAVLCVARSENPMFLEEGHEYIEEFGATLARKDMYLPNKTKSYKYKNNWSYQSVQKLMSLGILAGGTENDFKYEEHSAQKDLVYILINGIYRLEPESYTDDLYQRMEPYINEEVLTFDSMMRILGALYDLEGEPDTTYKLLCEQQRINDVFDIRVNKLKTNAEIITMDMVYYIGAYSICSFTGKDIEDVSPLYLTALEPSQ